MIQLQEPRQTGPFALFNLGFRPFFLLGGAAASLLMLYWLIAFSDGVQPGYYSAGLIWHGHEMLFGFSLAIIAGFLLTAVRNWTSVQTPYGTQLVLLTLLWLAGRLLPFVGIAPGWLVAAVDLAFAPAVAIGIAVPIIRARNFRNLLFIPILAAFFLANLLVHLEMLALVPGLALKGLHLALALVVLVITVIGGRVIPFFTERAVATATCRRYAWVEKSIVPVTAAWALLSLTDWAIPQLMVAAAAFLLHSIRVIGWYNRGYLAVPLLWILHLGYAFIALGFGLALLALTTGLSSSLALHAFGAGGIGCLTLGMAARVSLGHTARPLQTTPAITVAFALIGLAALVRISVLWLPLPYTAAIHLAGTLWAVAWLLFVIKYLPILIKPRLDGLYG